MVVCYLLKAEIRSKVLLTWHVKATLPDYMRCGSRIWLSVPYMCARMCTLFTVVGWLVDVIYPDPSLESDNIQAISTTYPRVRTCRVFR